MKATTNISWVLMWSTGRGVVRGGVLAAFVVAMLLVAGCAQSLGNEQAEEDQQKEEDLQQRIDELERQKEEDLQKQIDDLKAQQEEPPPPVVVENNENSPANDAPEGVVYVYPEVVVETDLEESALEAAINYYQAVEVGDFTYTYNALTSADQDNYTYDQWLFANNALDNAALEVEVFRALVDSPSTEFIGGYPHVADVGLTFYYPDGDVNTRYTFFVYEGGIWKHWLTTEEMDGFDSVL